MKKKVKVISMRSDIISKTSRYPESELLNKVITVNDCSNYYSIIKPLEYQGCFIIKSNCIEI